jgi:hypothetical protein
MNLAGATVREEDVRFLAALVDGELAAKLDRAITNDNTIVALSAADREHALAVLGETPPGGLLELRSLLMKQGDNARRRDAHAQRLRRDQRRTGNRDLDREGAAAADAVDGAR